VHADAEFSPLAPPLPPVSPAWSPVAAAGDGGPDGTGERGRPRASPPLDACADLGIDACRARGPGRRFARPRYPTAGAAADRCEAFGRRCIVF
jgi:hypothetical protein